MSHSPEVSSCSYRVPEIVFKHVDGPYLLCRDRSMRWLSLWERCLVFFKLTDASKLDATKYQVHDNTDLRHLLNKAIESARN